MLYNADEKIIVGDEVVIDKKNSGRQEGNATQTLNFAIVEK